MAQAPAGRPAPRDGALPTGTPVGAAPLGIYVHVPYCATRCGYCDFNTYTSREDEHASFAATVARELDVASRVLGGDAAPPVGTVHFGGGTPSLLPPAALAAVLRAIEQRFTLARDVEVALEANPETVSRASLAALRAAGFARISLGMQSAVPHVLAALERMHTPGRAVAAAREARLAGFDVVGLDLIYGTPGEDDDDWRRSLDAALSAAPDSVSAYPLVVERGTRLAAAVRRGRVAPPDENAQARRYLIAEETLAGAGFAWYELCNWARHDGAHCRHNLGYWRSSDWWGAGPGAHSHVAGTRWWNLLHPERWAARLAAGHSPAAGRELLGDEERRTEAVMLRLRLAEGLPLELLSPRGRVALDDQVAGGFVSVVNGRAVLTLQGRLIADTVTRALVV